MTTAVLMLLAAIPASAQKPLPVVDMHLHASAADDKGPPPLGCVCRSWITWTTSAILQRPWGDIFMEWQKKPPFLTPSGHPGPTMRS